MTDCGLQESNPWSISIKEEPVPMEIDQPNFKRQASGNILAKYGSATYILTIQTVSIDIEYPSPVNEPLITGNLKFEPSEVSSIDTNPIITDNNIASLYLLSLNNSPL